MVEGICFSQDLDSSKEDGFWAGIWWGMEICLWITDLKTSHWQRINEDGFRLEFWSKKQGRKHPTEGYRQCYWPELNVLPWSDCKELM
jgi:hypothetical protein